MVNLEKLLLAASTRLATTEENVHWSPPRQRRRKISFVDNEKDNDLTESSRKLWISQLPPEKNLAILKKDNDHRSGEGGSEGSNDAIVGSDLYKDEDNQQLMLEASATEKTDSNINKILKRRTCKQRIGSSHKVRAQSSLSKAERAEALVELVKRTRDAASAVRGSSCQCSSVDKMDLPAANVNDSNLTLSNEEESPEAPTLREIMGITVPRSQLVKWYMEPFFNELITGCFVRVSIWKGVGEAPLYRLCEVLNVDATDPNRQYEFENKTTCLYLNLVWGSGTPVKWQMAMVSDSPPRKMELDQWVREVKLNGGHMPTKQELLEKRLALWEKRQTLEKTNSTVYSPAIVKPMVEEKRCSAVWRPAMIEAEKFRLRRELELANDDDVVELKRIKARLEELDAIRASLREKAVIVDELNKKNLLEMLNNVSSKIQRRL